jgi:hypothetical protein
VGSLTPHNPIGLQGLLRESFTLLYFTFTGNSALQFYIHFHVSCNIRHIKTENMQKYVEWFLFEAPVSYPWTLSIDLHYFSCCDDAYSYIFRRIRNPAGLLWARREKSYSLPGLELRHLKEASRYTDSTIQARSGSCIRYILWAQNYVLEGRLSWSIAVKWYAIFFPPPFTCSDNWQGNTWVHSTHPIPRSTLSAQPSPVVRYFHYSMRHPSDISRSLRDSGPVQ